MLQFERVTKLYGEGDNAVAALVDVSLVIMRGHVVALFGPSGSGKTTLLQLAAGLDVPTDGAVRVDGRDLAALREGALTRLRRTEIGFVFQFFNLVPALAAVDNVALPLRFDGVSARAARARASEALGAMGLEHRAHHLPAELSGGEMQRVSVARALVTEPLLVLADEPTGSLDTRNGERVLELLAEAARERGIAIVLASHDPRAAGYAHRVLALRDGRLAEQELDEHTLGAAATQ